MKKTMCKLICVLLACALVFTAAFPAYAGTPAEDAHLHFNADGKFRILNFSDFQDGETLDGRVKDFIRRSVYTAQPDLIVLTGDNIYGDYIVSEGGTEKAIAQFMDIFESLGVPVAIVFGNHDDNGKALSKEKQMQIYNRYSVSVSYDEGSSMFGCGTYNVPIYGSAETDKVKFNLWMFDTGSKINKPVLSEFDYMRQDQLDWYVAKSNELKAANDGVPVPSIAFQHIIVNDIYRALKRDSSNHCYILPETAAPGSVMGENPSPSNNKNEREFSVIQQQGDVLAIVSGHDHLNMFVVPYQGVDLINTPAAGFFSNGVYYGDDETRGARIIDIDESGTYSTEMLFLWELAVPYYYLQRVDRKYVQRVALCVEQTAQHGGSRDAAMVAAYERMYAAVDEAHGNGVALWADLNGGSTADISPDNHYVICMGYTFTKNQGLAMRDLGLCRAGSSGASAAQYDRTTLNRSIWRLCNNNDLLVVGTDGAVDLNAGTSGDALCFVANNGLNGRHITEIRIVNTGSNTPIDMADYPDYSLAGTVMGTDTTPGCDPADLNQMASGDFIYALYRTVPDEPTYIELDPLPLLEARFQAVKLLQNSETLYSAESLAALQDALERADEILNTLYNYWETTEYDQAALDAAAYLVVKGMLGLETASFTVTFDANGGTCSEQSRTIVYGTACGDLPDAVKSYTFFGKTTTYPFVGWFTEREGGEQITPEMIFTATSDQTWYAHWSKPDDLMQIDKPIYGEPQEGYAVTNADDRFSDHQKYRHDAADVNADGSIDLRDITLLARHLAGGWNMDLNLEHADINADGTVDLRDVVLLRRYLAGGWNVELI